MRWSIAASTIIGVFVFVIFFWLTLKFLDYWNNSAVDASEIQIIDASYGLNCKVPTGNATEDVSTECNHKSGTCNYSVDVAKLGDPAPGCGKDFFVEWRCGSILDARRASLEPEAHGKSLEIFCATR
jgi:hypothetical protein